MSCPECGETYVSKAGFPIWELDYWLKYPTKRQMKKWYNPVTCKKCGTEFYTETGERREEADSMNVRRWYDQNIRKKKCPCCDARFRSQKRLNAHIEYNHLVEIILGVSQFLRFAGWCSIIFRTLPRLEGSE